MELKDMLEIAYVIGRMEGVAVMTQDATIRNYILSTIKMLKDIIWRENEPTE